MRIDCLDLNIAISYNIFFSMIGPPFVFEDACVFLFLHCFYVSYLVIYFIFLSLNKFFVFLRPQMQCMGVPRLCVESELQLLAYTTATVMPDQNHVCDLHHSSWQRRPGIELIYSWVLIGFISTEPRQELLNKYLSLFISSIAFCFSVC